MMPPARVIGTCLLLSVALPAAAQQPSVIPVEQLIAEANAYLKEDQFLAAAEIFEKALAANLAPAVADSVAYNRASALFRAPDYPRAVRAFEEYVARFPQSALANDARMARGIALALQEQWSAAAAAFSEVETVPSLRAQALSFRAECALRAGDRSQAIAAYEALLSLGVRDTNEADTIFTLVQLYFEENNLDRAEAALSFLRGRIQLVDSIVRLNAFTLQLGDRHLEGGRHSKALDAYREAISRQELLARQDERLRLMEDAVRISEAQGSNSPAVVDGRNRIKARIEQSRSLRAEVERAADYDASIWFRMGRSFFEGGKPWEGILLFEEIISRHPGTPTVEAAKFALVRACFEVNLRARALELCRAFQKEYPSSPFSDQIAFLAGQVAFERQEYGEAVELFGEAVARYPSSPLREQMIVLTANARFLKGEMEAARDQFRAYLAEYPKGLFTEDAAYRVAMASFFSGNYEAAVTDLSAYLAANPTGTYVADAEYRLIVCTFSARDYERAITEAQAWLSRHPGESQTGDVYSLLGDVYAGLGRSEEALEAYRQAVATAVAEDVVGYALNEMTKLLQAQGDQAGIAALHEDFVRRNPDSVLVPGALYWISRARTREGQPEVAAAFIADNVGRFIGDPSKEGVEKMLSQLAQILSRRPRAEPAQPRPPAPTFNELVDRLDAALRGVQNLDTNPARARVLNARAELARLNRMPADEARLIDTIADTFQPDDLSAYLLATVGLRLVERGDVDRAEPFLNQLVARFPKAEAVDAGYVGLGEVAFRRGDFTAALALFRDAIDKAGARTRAKEATLGQARALLELGRLDESEKLLQQIAASREWRGEATAQSVFLLGELSKRRKNPDAAAAYFERVYVAYQRFLPWVARAYLERGALLEERGMLREAAEVYGDMLRNQKLEGFSEVATARSRLEALQPRIGGT